MVYNASNKMTQFTATGVSVSYRYDAQERRVRQDSAGQTTIWVYDAFGQLAAEYSTNLTMTQGVYYRTTDHLGSTRIVTNQSAAVVQRRDFFPFGEAIPADSSHGNRQAVTDGGQPTYNTNSGVKQQFTGQQRDEETGLDYFNARNYSAPLGRFLSVDPGNAGATPPLPQSWNGYAYVNNQPCRYNDPTGMFIPFDDEGSGEGPSDEAPEGCGLWCRLILPTIIMQGGGSRPGGVSTSRAHAAAMRGLTTIASGEFKSKPGCVSFFQELAKSSGQGTDADSLMNKVIDIANEIIQNGYIYDGPTSNTVLTPDKFPNTASPGVQTVKAWFAADSDRSGLSQFNGAAIWIRFDQWDGYLDTYANNGTPKAYGLGLLLHEILHKQAVGGGFEHGYGPRGMDGALDASGAPSHVPGQLVYSASRMGKICFQ
jgi:RHS repeat-associated protein